MTGTVRLFIAGAKHDMIAYIKSGMLKKPGIEMVIAVDNPAEAENKINRQSLNVLLTDLDTVSSNSVVTSMNRQRADLFAIYTSVSSSRAMPFLTDGKDNFIMKPAVLTNQTAGVFVAALYKRIDSLRKQTAPLGVRDMSKIVSGNKKVIGIASSTGGTSALELILRALPGDIPPVVVVQHMPSGFTKLFADRLDAVLAMKIKEAQTGEYLKQGEILLAPADRHMKLVRQQGALAVECYVGIKMHGVMPAADVLFESMADLLKANGIGVILTGMGADGARGLMLMHNAGAKTIGQDKETCVVYGMPKVAKDLGAVDFELPIHKIAEKILSLV
jgi:two-component system chemotaxis response regulator CheB